MSSEGYHEPVAELSDETRDMHRAVVSLMEELEAVDWYNQRVDACKDEELKAVLVHNRDEEKEHAAMTSGFDAVILFSMSNCANICLPKRNSASTEVLLRSFATAPGFGAVALRPRLSFPVAPAIRPSGRQQDFPARHAEHPGRFADTRQVAPAP